MFIYLISQTLWLGVFDHNACKAKFTYRAPQSAYYYYNLFDPAFIGVAKKRNLDPELLKSIAWCETKLDPCAVSHVGARGIMQFMPGTFNLVSAAAKADNPFDPLDSIESAGVYIAALSNYWRGDIYAIVASYNAGPGNVLKARKLGLKIPNIPETQGYTQCVVGAYKQLKQATQSQPSAGNKMNDGNHHYFGALIKFFSFLNPKTRRP